MTYEDLKEGSVDCIIDFHDESVKGIIAISDDNRVFFLHNSPLHNGGSSTFLMKKYPGYEYSWYLIKLDPGKLFHYELYPYHLLSNKSKSTNLEFKNRIKIEL